MTKISYDFGPDRRRGLWTGRRPRQPGRPLNPEDRAVGCSIGTGCRPRWRGWSAKRAVAVIVAVASLVLLAAACGNSTPPSAGSGGSSGAGGSTDSQSTSSKLLAYSQCMRAHGVPQFPDPDSNGQIPANQLKNLTTSRLVIRSADDRCYHLYPTQPGINAPFSAQQKQDYLRAVACMRRHGLRAFPDPVFSGTQVQFPLPPGIDPNSPQFAQARQTCSHLIPPGLPYSGNSQ